MRSSPLPALGRVLFWSVIAAAFIGPGTVTTAAAAGAAYGIDLLWAVGFATLACLLLQEAAARLPLATGYSLGTAVAHRYPHQSWLRYALLLAILTGGVAYQSGNILGAVAGLKLLWPQAAFWLPLATGIGAAALLWPGRPGQVARWLGALVALMGLAFLALAWRLRPAWPALVEATFVPQLPAGSGWLVVGLLGTTIVPYNLFLGSGLPHQQRLGHMRQGLAVAILLGGLISGAILIAGTGLTGPFSFPALAQMIGTELGPGAVPLFALGLFAAGFTSAVTAPLASALTAQSLLGTGQPAWGPQGRYFRLVWGLTLAAGVGFGMSGVQPVPAIILAQALNGLILPLVVAILLLLINDPALVAPPFRNGWAGNLALLLVLGLTTLIGLRQVVRAGATALGLELPPQGAGWAILLPLALLVPGAVAYRLWRQGSARREA